MRVLLADKDPYGLAAMRSELEAPGVQIVTARDGREVIRLAAHDPPDLVIVASSLGQMGGFAVARELKMLADCPGAAPAPKVIVLLERSADAWLARWSRCDGWFTKPVATEDLERLVEEPAGSTSGT